MSLILSIVSSKLSIIIGYLPLKVLNYIWRSSTNASSFSLFLPDIFFSSMISLWNYLAFLMQNIAENNSLKCRNLDFWPFWTELSSSLNQVLFPSILQIQHCNQLTLLNRNQKFEDQTRLITFIFPHILDLIFIFLHLGFSNIFTNWNKCWNLRCKNRNYFI